MRSLASFTRRTTASVLQGACHAIVSDIDQANTLLLRLEDVTPLQSDIDFLQKDKESLTRVIQGHKDFIGVSPPMIEIRQLMGRVADTDMTILIEGETGTGKEVLAKALHAESKRCNKPFVKIDCAAIPENLESELFGHEKTFTGIGSACRTL
jgi:DNA-binding NtrC family response regulator